MEIQKRYTLSSAAIFVLFIVSMNHWIGWCDRAKYIYAIAGLFLWYAYKKERVKLLMSIAKLGPCIVAYLGYMIYEIGWRGEFLSSAPYTNFFIFLFPLIMVICIKPDDKKIILNNITAWFGVLMKIALVFYLISLFIQLPNLGIIEFSKIHRSTYSPCYNYFFLTIPTENLFEADHSFLRFQGPFIESGHLGMMCAFLLFANKFDFSNNSNIIILVTLLFTLSLAGYMLAVIGYTLVLYNNNKIKTGTIIVSLLIILLFYLFGIYYNGGDNFINESILSRLQYDEDKGFSGNHRTGVYVLTMFSNMFDNLKTALFGYDALTLKMMEDEFGTGFVWFSVHHGIIGVIAVLWFYFMVVNRAYDKQYAWLFLLFVFAVFFQRNYPFWFSWMICFDYGIQINDCSKRITN